MSGRGNPSAGAASDIGARRFAATPPGGPNRDARDRPDHRGHVEQRRTPPRLGRAKEARTVNRETVLIVGASSDIGARRRASAAPRRPAP